MASFAEIKAKRARQVIESSNQVREDKYNILHDSIVVTRSVHTVRDLLETTPFDMTYRDKKDATLFMSAMFSGSIEIMDMVLQKGADINASPPKGLYKNSYFNYCIVTHRRQVIDYLIVKGYDIAHVEYLVTAILKGKVDIARKIIEAIKAQNIDPYAGQNWWMVAALKINNKAVVIGMLNLLIETGALEWTNGEEISLAIVKNDLDILNILLATKRFNLEHVTKDHTPLQLSLKIANASFKLTKALLDAGAKVDSIDTNGRTVLLLACIYGSNVIIKYVMDRAPKPHLHLQDMDGVTPLMAISYRLDRPRTRELVLSFIKNGASIYQRDALGYRAIHYGSAFCNYVFVKALIELARDNVNDIPDVPQPLILAIGKVWPDNAMRLRNVPSRHIDSHHRVAIVELLIQSNAELNVRDHNGLSPLLLASSNSDVKLIMLLYKHNLRFDFSSPIVYLSLKNLSKFYPNIMSYLYGIHRLDSIPTPTSKLESDLIDSFKSLAMAERFNEIPPEYVEKYRLAFVDNQASAQGLFGTQFSYLD